MLRYGNRYLYAICIFHGENKRNENGKWKSLAGYFLHVFPRIHVLFICLDALDVFPSINNAGAAALAVLSSSL